MWGAVTRSDDVRKGNRRRILDVIRRRGLISRTDIGRETGLSAATVSAITSDLIAEGVLAGQARDDTAATGRGRPKIDLSVNPEAGLVGTMNFRLNAVTAVISDYAGTHLAESALTIDSSAASVKHLQRTLIRCMSEALSRSGHEGDVLRAIAIGVQGVTDVGGEALLWSPIVKHRNLPIRRWLEDEFSAPVRVCNDCDLMALALHWDQPERYGRNFAAILFGHGVGMGLFLRGGPINGTRSSGTEFGHMIHVPDGALCRCGSRGCIEAYAGDYAIWRRANRLPETAPPESSVNADQMQAIIDAARGGDADARTAIEVAGRAIGTGLASIYALVDPFPVALIGGGAITAEFFEPALLAAIGESIAVRNANDGTKGETGEIRIDYVRNDDPMVQKGCVIRALLALDEALADAAS